MRWAAVLLAVALAGCGEQAPAPPAAPAGPLVEGWVRDATLTPVAGAVATLAGTGVEGTTDAEGHYALQAPPGVDLVLVVEADGFRPASRGIAAASGAHHVLNLTLERLPSATPHIEVAKHTGTVRCGAVATVQEDPSRPHEHQGVRCSQLLNDTSNQWLYEVPANASGVIVEAFWEPRTEMSLALVLKVTVEATGETIAFLEDMSGLRVQLASARLAQEAAAGHTTLRLTLEPGAGTGNHEHGAAGLFLEQPFDLFASSFHDQPVDPAYTVASQG